MSPLFRYQISAPCMIKRLEVMELWIWRRMKRTKWTKCVTNEEFPFWGCSPGVLGKVKQWKLKQFAEIVYKFWLQNRSKFGTVGLMDTLILEQFYFGGAKRYFVEGVSPQTRATGTITVCQWKEILMSIVRERQAKWIGHVHCHDSLLRDIIDSRVSGNGPNGRPRRKTLDWMIDKVNGKRVAILRKKLSGEINGENGALKVPCHHHHHHHHHHYHHDILRAYY